MVNSRFLMKFFFFLIFAPSILFGQRLQEADALFNSKDYVKAKEIYASIVKSNPYDSKINLKWGRCLLETGEGEKAIYYLEFASKRIPEANIFLGDAYYFEYRFQDAINAYNKLLESTEVDSIIVSISSRLEKANTALRMLSAVEEVQIIDSFIVSKSNFFSHYKLKGIDAGQLYVVNERNNSLNQCLTTGYLSPREDRKVFSDTINGNADLYISYKLLDGWSSKQVLSEVINTEANENFPFIRSDGVTMYYCSDGNTSLGGYDIYVARYNNVNNDFMLPENVGMPFNSPFNDYLMVIDDENRVGWFATDRYQAKDTIIIYQFKPNEKRIYVDSEDSVYVINKSKLKVYSLYTKDVDLADELDFVPINKESAIKTMHFVINDNIVYSSITQFVSEEAKDAYELGKGNENKAKEIENKLEQLRREYASLNSDIERKNLVVAIRTLEIEYDKIRELPNNYFKDARNLEIQKLMQDK